MQTELLTEWVSPPLMILSTCTDLCTKLTHADASMPWPNHGGASANPRIRTGRERLCRNARRFASFVAVASDL